MEYIGDAFGYIAGICTAITFLPQTIETIRTNNVSGISLTTYIIYIIGIISWIAYGIYLDSVQMIIFNGISLIFASIVAALVIKSRISRRKNAKNELKK